MQTIPTVEQIARMTPGERGDLVGWIKHERRLAEQIAAEADRAGARIRNEANEQESRSRAAREHMRALGIALMLPDLSVETVKEGA